MKVLLLYFSGTGNTLYVVNKISEVLRKRNYLTEIHSIEEKIKINPSDFDILILGCPKYYEYPVLDFIHYIKNCLPVSQKTMPTMMFCTQVAHLKTNFDEIEKILTHKNYKLLVTKSIPLANNMVIFDTFPLTEPEKVKENLNQLDEDLRPLLTALMTGREMKEKTNQLFGLVCHLSGHIFTSLFARFFVKYSSCDACTGCGLCAKKCPKKNIVIKEKHPQFGRNCIFCMRCINICPSNAILYQNRQCEQYKPLKNSW